MKLISEFDFVNDKNYQKKLIKTFQPILNQNKPQKDIFGKELYPLQAISNTFYI